MKYQSLYAAGAVLLPGSWAVNAQGPGQASRPGGGQGKSAAGDFSLSAESGAVSRCYRRNQTDPLGDLELTHR
jgi:hypothetical protein